MSNLISLAQARLRLNASETVFLDARFTFGAPEEGRAAYRTLHIPGAVHFDLNEDLSGPIERHGGRHPLPDPDLFARKLGDAGIGPETAVIVYDDQRGALAARLWWMLRFYGHDRVQVMDTGFSEWHAAGYPVTSELSAPQPNTFVPNLRVDRLTDAAEIAARLGEYDHILIDSRTSGSYTAEQPTKYPVNGHIPGALNLYWEDGVSADGVFQPADIQKQRFADLPVDAEYIVYCNAGVTACPNVLALTEAGYRNVRLYVGSWGDWISYGNLPVATGKSGTS